MKRVGFFRCMPLTDQVFRHDDQYLQIHVLENYSSVLKLNTATCVKSCFSIFVVICLKMRYTSQTVLFIFSLYFLPQWLQVLRDHACRFASNEHTKKVFVIYCHAI